MWVKYLFNHLACIRVGLSELHLGVQLENTLAPLFVTQILCLKLKAVDSFVAQAHKGLTEWALPLPDRKREASALAFDFTRGHGFKLHQKPMQFAGASKAHFIGCRQGTQPGLY